MSGRLMALHFEARVATLLGVANRHCVKGTLNRTTTLPRMVSRQRTRDGGAD